jgi:hypothetical protein
MARNKHPGPCYLCGVLVKAGTGHFERHEGKWRVKHANISGFGRVTCDQAKPKQPAQKGYDVPLTGNCGGYDG